MKVLVDTSFLIYCADKGKDFLSMAEESLGERLECYVIEDVLRELKGLARNRGKRGALAGVALKMAERMTLISSDLPDTLTEDQKLLETARLRGMALATTDWELISEARKRGVPVITVKKNQSVIFLGTRLKVK